MDDVALGQVKDCAASWVAWFMVAIFVIGCGIAVTLKVAKGGFDPHTLTLYLAFTGFMVVGAVIGAQRPELLLTIPVGEYLPATIGDASSG
jgi:hypothetical protein